MNLIDHIHLSNHQYELQCCMLTHFRSRVSAEVEQLSNIVDLLYLQLCLLAKLWT